MLNMIKMDLYRMCKTKSMYVIWAVMALMIVITTPLMLATETNEGTEHSIESFEAEEMEEQEEDSEVVEIGIGVYVDTKPGEKVTVYEVVYANMCSRVIALFIVIFTILFATADMNSGYIKNIGGQVRNRGQLVLSKAVSVFIYTVITIVLFSLIQAAANGVVLGYIEWGNMGEFLLYIGTQIFLHFALAMICMAIAIILRNNVVSMIVSICLCMNLLIMLYGAIDKLLYKIGIENFHVSNYTITGKITMLSNELTTRDGINAVCLSIVFIIIMTALSGIVFEKRDI